MTCSRCIPLGFSACHEDSDMSAPFVVCIGQLSLVLWFIYIVYNMPTLTHGII